MKMYRKYFIKIKRNICKLIKIILSKLILFLKFCNIIVSIKKYEIIHYTFLINTW